MIRCVFTLDYEIYGNGRGTLRDLVVDPTLRLAELFDEFNAPFVIFAEAVEFAKIRESQSDLGIGEVEAQMRELRAAGHEIGLHLHPWWANARYENAEWVLDWSERSICGLSRERIDTIVSNAISYLRKALSDPSFVPLSFRNGLWAMQPTQTIAEVLAQHRVQVDSSVFKGGRIGSLGLDYRRAPKNDGSWRFSADVASSDPQGRLLELPIHTEMVPFWEMLGGKRLKVHKKMPTGNQGTPLPGRWRDFLRFRYPRKLDFCRMSFVEMRDSISGVINRESSRGEDQVVVAIGHSKDFVDRDAVGQFLAFLQDQSIEVTTFARLLHQESGVETRGLICNPQIMSCLQ